MHVLTIWCLRKIKIHCIFYFSKLLKILKSSNVLHLRLNSDFVAVFNKFCHPWQRIIKAFPAIQNRCVYLIKKLPIIKITDKISFEYEKNSSNIFGISLIKVSLISSYSVFTEIKGKNVKFNTYLYIFLHIHKPCIISTCPYFASFSK